MEGAQRTYLFRASLFKGRLAEMQAQPLHVAMKGGPELDPKHTQVTQVRPGAQRAEDPSGSWGLL